MSKLNRGRGGLVTGRKIAHDVFSNMVQDYSTNQLNLHFGNQWKLQVSTDSPFTGQRSILSQGTANFGTLSTSLFNTGTGDWTFECWIKMSNATGFNFLCDFRDAANRYIGINNGALIWNNGTTYTSTGALTANVWTHCAWVRNGGNFQMYRGGTQVYSAAITRDIPADTICRIYGLNVSVYLFDCRFVKGTAVYTAAFTPPTEPLLPISGTSLLANAAYQYGSLVAGGA